VQKNTKNGEVGGEPRFLYEQTGDQSNGTSELIKVMPDEAPPGNAS